MENDKDIRVPPDIIEFLLTESELRRVKLRYEMLKLFEEGFPKSEIAQKLNITTQAVASFLGPPIDIDLVKKVSIDIESPYLRDIQTVDLILENKVLTMQVGRFRYAFSEYEAIGCKFFSDNTQDEAADYLGKSFHTVKNQIFLARKRNKDRSFTKLVARFEILGLLDRETYCGILLIGRYMKANPETFKFDSF